MTSARRARRKETVADKLWLQHMQQRHRCGSTDEKAFQRMMRRLKRQEPHREKLRALYPERVLHDPYWPHWWPGHPPLRNQDGGGITIAVKETATRGDTVFVRAEHLASASVFDYLDEAEALPVADEPGDAEPTDE